MLVSRECWWLSRSLGVDDRQSLDHSSNPFLPVANLCREATALGIAGLILGKTAEPETVDPIVEPGVLLPEPSELVGELLTGWIADPRPNFQVTGEIVDQRPRLGALQVSEGPTWLAQVQGALDRVVVDLELVLEEVRAELSWETALNAFDSGDGLIVLGKSPRRRPASPPRARPPFPIPPFSPRPARSWPTRCAG